MMMLISPREGERRLTSPVWLCMLATIPDSVVFCQGNEQCRKPIKICRATVAPTLSAK
jgi:hypothetical protein